MKTDSTHSPEDIGDKLCNLLNYTNLLVARADPKTKVCPIPVRAPVLGRPPFLTCDLINLIFQPRNTVPRRWHLRVTVDHLSLEHSQAEMTEGNLDANMVEFPPSAEPFVANFQLFIVIYRNNFCNARTVRA